MADGVSEWPVLTISVRTIVHCRHISAHPPANAYADERWRSRPLDRPGLGERTSRTGTTLVDLLAVDIESIVVCKIQSAEAPYLLAIAQDKQHALLPNHRQHRLPTDSCTVEDLPHTLRGERPPPIHN